MLPISPVKFVTHQSGHSEQKNFTHVRTLFGYQRFDSEELVDLMNDYTAVYMGISDPSIVEGTSGAVGTLTFTVGLSAPSSQTITVNYTTADGIATAGLDYQAASGTLTFAPGETTKMIPVPIVGDTLSEGNESFALKLSGANVTIVKDTGVGTITNDDTAPAY